MSRRPRLTLCLIARDEERMLPGCLASVQGVVDAIVVVDTGSTDRTVALAQQAGATVVEHAWDDDFAAARNAALPHVRDGFVLVLDADERLAPGAGAALSAALHRGGFDCGLLPLSNAATLDADPREVVGGRARLGAPVRVIRLLRRTPDLAWEGLVHEQPLSWLRGKRVVDLEVPIVHYGGVPDLRRARGKDLRNQRLLEKRCRAEPRNAHVRACLARELLRCGDEAGARREADRAWECVVANSRGGKARDDVVTVATVRLHLLLADQRLEPARETLALARRMTEPHPNLELLWGVVLTRCAHPEAPPEEAAEALRACLSMDGRAFQSECLPGATSWAARARLGCVHLLRGEPRLALEQFERALEVEPRLPEAVLGRLEALIAGGREAEALRSLEPHLLAGLPDAWALAAQAAALHGGHDDVRLFAERARAAGAERGWVEPLRAGRLQALVERLAS